MAWPSQFAAVFQPPPLVLVPDPTNQPTNKNILYTNYCQTNINYIPIWLGGQSKETYQPAGWKLMCERFTSLIKKCIQISVVRWLMRIPPCHQGWGGGEGGGGEIKRKSGSKVQRRIWVRSIQPASQLVLPPLLIHAKKVPRHWITTQLAVSVIICKKIHLLDWAESVSYFKIQI